MGMNIFQFMAAIELGCIVEPYGSTDSTIKVVSDPKHTNYLFGGLEEIAGQELKVMERNRHGCLCHFVRPNGEEAIVDVNNADIEK